MERIKADSSYRPSIDEVEEAMPQLQGQGLLRPVPRALSRVINDARSFIFEPRETQLLPYRIEADHKTTAITDQQKLALRAGILGTFVGMILAVTNMGDMFSTLDTVQAADGITFSTEAATSEAVGENSARALAMSSAGKELVIALSIAFGTSVAGLHVAMVLGLFSAIARNAKEKYLLELENTIGDLTELARRAMLSSDGWTAQIGEMKTVVKGASANMDKRAEEISAKVQRVSGAVQFQTDTVQNGLVKLKTAHESWMNFLDLLRSEQVKHIDDMKQFQIDAKGEYSELIQAQTQSRNQLLDELDKQQKCYINEVHTVTKAVTDGSFLDSIREELRSSVDVVGSNFAAQIESIVNRIEDSNDQYNRSSEASEKLAATMTAFSEVVHNADKKLGEWKKVRSDVDEVRQELETAFKSAIERQTEQISDAISNNNREFLAPTLLSSFTPLQRELVSTRLSFDKIAEVLAVKQSTFQRTVNGILMGLQIIVFGTLTIGVSAVAVSAANEAGYLRWIVGG